MIVRFYGNHSEGGRKLAICPNCRNSVEEGAKFCPYCGYSLLEASKVEEKICPKCGAPYEEGQKSLKGVIL